MPSVTGAFALTRFQRSRNSALAPLFKSYQDLLSTPDRNEATERLELELAVEDLLQRDIQEKRQDSQRWLTIKPHLYFSTERLLFLRDKIIPLTSILIQESEIPSSSKSKLKKTIDNQKKQIEDTLSRRGQLYLEEGHDDQLFAFHAELGLGSAPGYAPKPLALRTAQAIRKQTLPVVHLSGVADLLESLELKDNYAKSFHMKIQSKSPTVWQKAVKWFKGLGSWIGWIAKAAIIAALVAAIAFIAIQGASVISVGLIIAVGAVSVATFMYQYVNRFINWLTGKSVIIKLKEKASHSEFQKLVNEFASESLLTRSHHLIDKNYENLGETALTLLGALELYEKGLRSQIPNGWMSFRRKNKALLKDYTQNVSDYKGIITQGLAKVVKHIRQRVEIEMYGELSEATTVFSKMHLAELNAFMRAHASEDELKLFNEHTNIPNQLVKRIDNTFLFQPESYVNPFNLPFGLHENNPPKIVNFFENIAQFVQPEEEEAYACLQHVLCLMQAPERETFDSAVESLYTSTTTQRTAKEAFAAYVYKSSKVYDPQWLPFLTQEQTESISSHFQIQRHTLDAFLERFDSAILSPKHAFIGDIHEFTLLLDLAHIHGVINGHSPTMKEDFQNQLSAYVTAYDGQAIRDVHNQLLELLPDNEQAVARDTLSRRRFERLIDEQKKEVSLGGILSEADKDLLMHPTVNLTQRFWEHANPQSVTDGKFKGMLGAMISVGILPPSVYLAADYMGSSGIACEKLEGSLHENQAIIEVKNEMIGIAHNLCPALTDERDPLQIQAAFDSFFTTQARFEVLAHIDPSRATTYYRQSTLALEDSYYVDNGASVVSPYLAQLKQLCDAHQVEALTVLPFLKNGANDAGSPFALGDQDDDLLYTGGPSEQKTLPTGDLKSITAPQLREMCESDLLFAHSAIRNPAFFRCFNELQEYCLSTPSLILEYIVMSYRMEEIGHAVQPRSFYKFIYGALDTRDPNTINDAIARFTATMVQNSDNNALLAALMERLYPFYSEHMQVCFSRTSLQCAQILCHSDRRIDAFDIILSNYPQRHGTRDYAIEALNTLVDRAAYKPDEQRRLEGFIISVTGLDKPIPKEMITLHDKLNIRPRTRNPFMQSIFDTSVAFYGALRGTHRRLVERMKPYFKQYEHPRHGVDTLVKKLYYFTSKSNRTNVIADIEYLERLVDCPRSVKSLFLRNRVLTLQYKQEALGQRKRALAEQVKAITAKKPSTEQEMKIFHDMSRPTRCSAPLTQMRRLVWAQKQLSSTRYR